MIVAFLLLSLVNGVIAFQPYTIIWNAPSMVCAKKWNITMPLAKYGIRHNVQERFLGDQITLFYERDLGLYPYITSDDQAVYGGVPQASDQHRHIRKVRGDLTRLMPNVTMNGLAIIDWESWRFRYEVNWSSKRVYQKLSNEIAKKQYPMLNKTQIANISEHEFNHAARHLILSTLRVANGMRPYAKWGMWGLPMCNTGKSTLCTKSERRFNRKIHWLYEYSNALYPSIYLHNYHLHNLTDAEKLLFVDEILMETYRYKQPYHVIYPYMKYVYDCYNDTLQFYSLEDICHSLRLSADYGMNGIVIWSSYDSLNTKHKCQSTHQYIDNVLGPYAQTVAYLATACSESLCNARGRCRIKYRPLTCNLFRKLEDYTCECLRPYYGVHCEKNFLHSNDIIR